MDLGIGYGVISQEVFLILCLFGGCFCAMLGGVIVTLCVLPRFKIESKRKCKWYHYDRTN